MHTQDTHQRLAAARELLRLDTTTAEKFEEIEKLLAGIHPKLDKTLHLAAAALKKVEQFQETAIIELTTEALPEKTDKQKKRKKYLLLFLEYWDDLRDEVERIKAELLSNDSKAVKSGKIAGLARGPLGSITAIAAVIAGGLVLLNTVAVSVVIKNKGCDTIEPKTTVTIALPGLSLPNQSIPNGGQATATLPPLKLSVDGSSGTVLILKAYGLTMQFNYSGDVAIVFDGKQLTGTMTDIDLGSKKEHELVIICT